jgi:Sulfotransferase family
LKKYLQLAALILKHGTLRHSGQNFNADRAKSLEKLKEFIPPTSALHSPQPEADSDKKSSGKSLVAQAAFIKSSFQNSGGHLSVQNLAYIRIPKAANTSLSYALLAKQYPALTEKNPDETQINYLTDVHLKEVTEFGSETFFTVVRNPFARLVSVYRDFFETQRSEFIYANYLFGLLPQTISFPEFIDRISRIPDRLKDQHLRPQHLFISPYEKKGRAVKVFKLENTAELKSFFAEHDMQLTHQNKSAHPYDYASYYTQASLRQAYEIYKADLSKFGYRQDYEQLKQAVKP